MASDIQSFLQPDPVGPKISRLLRNLPPRVDELAMTNCIHLIWDSLLTHFADPVRVTVKPEARIITFMGATRYTVSLCSGRAFCEELRKDGTGFTVATKTAINLPARLSGAWLNDFLAPWWGPLLACLEDRTLSGCEGIARACILQELKRTVAQATHWRRIRHALRDALALDATLLGWMRPGRHRLHRFVITHHTYNRALSRRHQYEQIVRECPSVLWLYNMMDELEMMLPWGDVIAALRTELLYRHRLTPAAWRYLLRCDHRHFLHVIDFIGEDGSTATRWNELGYWLRWVAALNRRTPLHPALTCLFAHDAFAGKDENGHLTFRTAPISPGTMRAILTEAERRQAAGTLNMFIVQDLVAVVTWLQVTKPTLDANQIRRGWNYLAREADCWRADLAGRSNLQKLTWSSLLPALTDGPWRVLPITDAWALREEALAMRHCADNTLNDCLEGNWRLFSIRTPAGKRRATIGIRLNDTTWKVGDVRLFANTIASYELQRLARALAVRYGRLWSLIERESELA